MFGGFLVDARGLSSVHIQMSLGLGGVLLIFMLSTLSSRVILLFCYIEENVNNVQPC